MITKLIGNSIGGIGAIGVLSSVLFLIYSLYLIIIGEPLHYNIYNVPLLFNISRTIIFSLFMFTISLYFVSFSVIILED
jgi:hypothetical protein